MLPDLQRFREVVRDQDSAFVTGRPKTEARHELKHMEMKRRRWVVEAHGDDYVKRDDFLSSVGEYRRRRCHFC